MHHIASKKIFVSFALCTMLFACLLYAQAGELSIQEGRLIPKLLNYQGYLTDTLGIPIDDSLDMTFKVFDAASSGNELWSEMQTNVPIERGVFSVILGGITPIPDSVFADFTSTWLELTLEGPQTLTPRTRIVSSAYAYTATYSDTALYARNAAADNDWSFLVSDGADTTLQTGGRWGLARAGNTLYGNADSTYVNFGVACTTGTNGQNYRYCTVGGGHYNSAGGGFSATVSGGDYNKANGNRATVGGGQSNTASGWCATVSGGIFNTASNWYATVGGGEQNGAGNQYATVGGGRQNTASGWIATVSGGWSNTASSERATVSGGEANMASDQYTTVGGGQANMASSVHATVAGGRENTASGYAAIVGGGWGNTASGYCATVAGGGDNDAGEYATVGGGGFNDVAGAYSAILGGYADTIFAGANYSYLFGINSNLTQDSTFMVDMPHVWFGTEASGYEFPTTDGTNGQALVTDGSGQVSWGSSGDNDWSFLISNGADTTLQTGGRWGIARAGNTLYGNADSTHVNLGIDSRTGANETANYKYCTVGGGYNNSAYLYATVAGGGNNAAAEYGTVAGGYYNSATNLYAAVVGGDHNTASGQFTFVGGGQYNTANVNFATVVSGSSNIASGIYATVGGGHFNKARGQYSVVSGGGGPNEADSNSAIGTYSSIGGGRNNIASVEGATVGGGLRNTASGIRATVGGGLDNTASGLRATVGGGYLNTASLQQATVGGGYNNTASGVDATVGGGEGNTASDSFNFIGGGYYNYAAGKYSAILGGYADTITATGDYSYLFGINSNLTQDSTFMVDMPHIRFGDETNGYEFPTADGSADQVLVTDGGGQVSWGSSGDNDWVINSNDMYAGVSGNVGIGISNPLVKLDVNGVICGGVSDTVKGVYGGVLAGYSNLAGDQVLDTAATVVGGWNNSAIADYSFVGGGNSNTASYVNATIVGGDHNTASGHTSFIGGGYNNNASIDYATICGGGFNNASGVVSTVAGGNSNTTSGNYAFIGGGSLNTASGHLSVVAGGQYNATIDSFSFIGSGDKNHTAGKHSAILGGYADTITATGDYSYLFGINSNLTQDSTFMIDMPHIRFGDETNGYEFPSTDGSADQVMVTNGSGQLSWTNKSPTGFTPANSGDSYGDVGNIAWDDDYVYVKTSNGWKRAQLSSW
jgi:hypothetical protein